MGLATMSRFSKLFPIPQARPPSRYFQTPPATPRPPVIYGKGKGKARDCTPKETITVPNTPRITLYLVAQG